MRFTRMMTVSGGAMLTLLLAQSGGTQPRTAETIGSDWPMYRHDLAGTGYSPLTQIDTEERREADPRLDLSPAERRARGRCRRRSGAGGVNSQATPIVVNGVMYLPAANRVVALEPETGKEIWRYPVTGGAPSRRGVAYWPGEGGNPPRIIFTAGRRLIALNARTGALDAGFGTNGEVDMVVPYNSVPLDLQERRRRRRQHAAGRHRRHRQSARVRCAHGREAVGIQLGAAAGTGRSRHLGGRQLEGPPRRQRLAVLLHARRAARAALSAAGVADRRRVRRRPEGRQPVRQLGRRRRRPDRRIQVALSDHPSRSLGRRSAGAARTCSTSCGTDARIPALALTTKSGYLYILNRETGQPIFGVEERPVAEERRARRAGVSHAADSR